MMYDFRVCVFTALFASAVLLTGCSGQGAASSVSETSAWESEDFTVTYSDAWTDITPEDTGGVAGVSLSRKDAANKMTVGIFDASSVLYDSQTMAEQLLASKEDNAAYGITYTERSAAEGKIFGYTAWYAEWVSAHETDAPSRSRVYYIQQDGKTVGVTLYAADAEEFEALTAALPQITLTIAP